jgi:uncharacterized protein (TIGR02145 family)
MRIKVSTFILLLITLFFPGCRKDEKPADPVTDIDGNPYKIISVAGQVWMSENLKTTKLNDGTDISLIADKDVWNNLTTPGYCWYNNDAAAYKDTYGALYNSYTIATGKLCPAGWHIPEVKEWRELREHLGDSVKAGGRLKEAGTSHWLSPNRGADNSSGFTALPSGIRYFEGTFASLLTYTSFWSATNVSGNETWSIGLYYAEPGLTIQHKNKKYGFSVRCLKDQENSHNNN